MERAGKRIGEAMNPQWAKCAQSICQARKQCAFPLECHLKTTSLRGFDEDCLRLAEKFARDWYNFPTSAEETASLCKELAQRIQDDIEDFEREKGINP